MLTPADEANHINKWNFKVPFVCGATNLGEALRRIAEGAAMIRTKGEAGTGNVVEAVRHMRSILGEIRRLQSMDEDELYAAAKEHRAPYDLVRSVAEHGRLPVVTFTAGGIATPADAALMMQLGADGVFVGSGIFKSGDPAQRAAAIVKATTHYNDAAGAGRGVDRPGRADGRHRDVGAWARTVCCRRVAGRVGVLALQGAFREHVPGAGRRRAGAGRGAPGRRAGRAGRAW